jgi:hypothetical protein
MKIFVGKYERRWKLGRLCVNGRVILKSILKEM